MMEPLSVKQPSRTSGAYHHIFRSLTVYHPAQITFQAYMESVAAAKKEVQDFQDLRKSEKITNIMEHATQRRKEEPNGIKAWRTTDHPDWTTTDS